ncbi:alpha-methylacyl-CoA racemase [Constrictibacter sp. MBR-5]|jgi:alpha-methylacyl-CoA racemase|uniref:CaiB/BaiF CoA transferase family protein n=1 Tax=Constrictibacter sp. MBR-5 TaxID=3156467 RepID=UPI0033921B4C
MGPLTGVKVVELAGIGPGPFCCMLLADMGAEVVRVDRTANVGKDGDTAKWNLLTRGRRNIAVDLKTPEGVETVLKLIEQADAVIEGFRPGVTERLGLGPDVCMKRNEKLVYGRMTGWGQDGPIAGAAGHDINYISLSGALHAIGERNGPPTPPLNLVGDFGGGALYMAVGVLAAVIEARTSGKGQVVDCSMVEGSASLMTAMYGALAAGTWIEERGKNRLDKGAHYYNVYETKDGKHVSIGSIEPQFYKLLLQLTGLEGQPLPPQSDRDKWPEMTERFAAIFKTKTRDEWCAIMENTDICFAPILSMSEAMKHPQNVARGSFVTVDGVPQPGPAPRFSRTAGEIQRPPAKAGEHTDEALAAWGFSQDEIAKLRAAGAVA